MIGFQHLTPVPFKEALQQTGISVRKLLPGSGYPVPFPLAVFCLSFQYFCQEIQFHGMQDFPDPVTLIQLMVKKPPEIIPFIVFRFQLDSCFS